MSDTIEFTRSHLRSEMPVTKKWAYFDHAAVAPLTAAAAAALEFWLKQATEEGDTAWLVWAKQLRKCREAAAKLLDASTEEIAMVPNTTAGITLVAEGIDWRAGDNIVTLDDEFPPNVYPWMNQQSRGVEVRRVPTSDGRVDLNQLAEHCDERTRVVSVSWIGYANGCRRDLAAISQIAHRYDALFFVDAIQGLGVFPLNVDEAGIDCLSADGHKWLLGPEGAGIAYIRREWLDRLRPIGVGWHSVVHSNDYTRIELTLKDAAERYEGGSHNMAGFLALGLSLRVLMDLGTENVAATILDFNGQAAEQLQSLGATIYSPWGSDDRSGIITFDLPGCDPQRARAQCLEKNVVLNCRNGRIRISPHAYNNQDDLQQLVDALKSLT